MKGFVQKSDEIRHVSPDDERDARYRALVLATNQQVWSADQSGHGMIDTITSWWESMTGQLNRASAGIGWFDKVHEQDYAKTRSIWQKAMVQRTPFGVDCRVQSIDETYHDLAIRGVPVFNQDGSLREWVGTINDVTESKRAERDYRLLIDLDELLCTLSDPEQLEQICIARVGQYMNAMQCSFAHVENDQQECVVEQEWRIRGRTALGHHHIANYLPPQFLLALETGSPGIVSDVDRDPRTSPFAHRYHEYSLSAFVIVPCIVERRWRALLYVGNEKPRVWREHEVRLLQDVVARVWPVLERARAQRRLRAGELRLHLALEAGNVGIHERNIMTGEMVWDQRMRAHWDLPADIPVTYDLFLKGLHPDDRQKTQAAIERALDPRGDGSYAALYRVLGHRDGIERWIEAKGQVFFVNGRPVRMVGTTLDITARRRAELRLQRSEGMLMRAQRGAKAGVWEIDLATGQMTWSTPYLDLYGWDHSVEPSLDSWLANIHPDDRARIEAAYRDSTERKTDQDWRFRIVRPDGAICWFHRKGQVEFDEQKRPVRLTGITFDITEQAQAEVELTLRNRQQLLLHELADAVNRPHSLTDLYEKALDTILSSLNADRASILLFDGDVMRFTAWRGISDGYRRAVEGHSPWRRDTPDPQAIVMGDIAEADLDPKLRALIQHEGIHALAFIPLTYGGTLIGKFMVYFNRPYTMTVEEISLAQAVARTLALGIERKRGEEALTENERQFRATFDLAAVGKTLFDVGTRKFLRVNDRFCQISGYRREELLNLSPADLTHPDDRATDEEGFAKLLVGEADEYHCEKRYLRPDGTVRWVAVAVHLIRDVDGHPLRTTAVVQDVTDRKRAEDRISELNQELGRRAHELQELVKRLEEGEAKMALITDSLPVLVSYIDRNERYQFINRCYEEWFGYSREAIVGRTVREILGEEAYQKLKPRIDRVLSGEVQRFEEWLDYQEVGRKYVSVVYTPDQDPQGHVRGLFVMVHDMSERKLAEETLRRTFQFDEAVMRNMAEGLYTVDREGRITYMNPAAERFFGWTFDELRGRNMHEMVHHHRPDGTPFPVEECEALRVLRRGQAVGDYEDAFIHKDGSFFDVVYSSAPLREDGEVTGLVVVFRDISDRKRAEAALRESEERLAMELADMKQLQKVSAQLIHEGHAEALYEQIIDAAMAIMRSDCVSMQMLHPERGDGGELRLLAHRGLSQEAAARWEWVSADSTCSCGAALRTGERVIVRDVQQSDFLAGTDDLATYLQTGIHAIQSTPLISRSGKIVGMISTHWRMPYNPPERDLRLLDLLVRQAADLIERKQAADALLSLNADLERRVSERTDELVQSQERLRALATELNLTEQRERKRLATDLHDYLGQLLALSKIKLGQIKQRAVVPLVAKGVGEVQQILDQALTYTRSLVAQLSPPVLHEFGLLMALEWLADQMKERDLIVTLDLPNVQVRLSEERAVLLFQSVRELLMNIVKHAKTKGAKIVVRRTERNLTISVEDEGAGFDLAAAGAGAVSSAPRFGLFSIRERMLALGGSLEVTSGPGQGTRATLIVPLAPKTAEDELQVTGDGADHEDSKKVSDRSSPVTHHTSLSPIRVLIADDHPMVRQGLCGLLDAHSEIEVVGEAANGEEAVALASQFQPDIVLMDISMPKMDGVEATKRIKQAWPGMTVIGLSVHAAGPVEAAMKEAGATAFMNKEVAVDDLYQTIQTACAVHRSNAERSSGVVS